MGAGSNLLFVAAASSLANRFSVSATGQLLRTMDNIPHPNIFYERYFYAANLPPSLRSGGHYQVIKVSGRGNLDHEQFVTSSISHTLRTKTDL